MYVPEHPVHATASQQTVAEFAAVCEQSVALKDYPHATAVQDNVLIYPGERLRGSVAVDRSTLMSEVHRALAEGPGVIVIKDAYCDPGVIDRHNAVFERILHDEAARVTRADHFAQAGANSRIWNSLQKVAQYEAEAFLEYYANPVLALVCEAWLGPWYQMTSQVNIVRPGGKAQRPHRDYHLGFQEEVAVERFALAVQCLTQYLTLQGAVAHTDMPVESGPTRLLPFSQHFALGYLTWRRPEFIDYFEEHSIQLALAKGDALFFSPALFHGAGENRTANHVRTAHLLQVSSAFAKPMESVDRVRLVQEIYPVLRARYQDGGLEEDELGAVIAAAADGYPFPTNLDTDPPLDGLAPQSQQQLLYQALRENWNPARLGDALTEQHARRRP